MKKLNCSSTGQMPDESKNIKVTLSPGNTITAPIYLPYYYASISSFWIYFRVDLEKLNPLLRGTGFKAANFGGKGLFNLNFENYTGHNGNGLAATNELECNIVVYPRSREKDIPTLSPDCFLAGQDQTKIFGHYRLHVPCDNVFAIAAGKALYGENKYQTNFSFTVPSLNLPTAKTWEYEISDMNNMSIVTVDADIQQIVPSVVNPAAVIDYSILDGKAIGSRRNFFSTFNHYSLNAGDARKIKVNIGKSKFEHIARDLSAILGRNRRGGITTRPYACQVIQTPPVIAEARAYFI